MKISVRLACATTLVGILTLGATPSSAASSATGAYLSNIRLNAAFLEQASKLAAANGQDEKLKAFARDEAGRQQTALAGLQKWEQLDKGINSALKVASDAELGVTTGRSVAVDPAEAASYTPPDAGATLPAAAFALNQMNQAKGESFDDLYRATQMETLQRLRGFYEAYAQTGDDNELRTIALRQLDKVKADIAALDDL